MSQLRLCNNFPKSQKWLCLKFVSVCKVLFHCKISIADSSALGYSILMDINVPPPSASNSDGSFVKCKQQGFLDVIQLPVLPKKLLHQEIIKAHRLLRSRRREPPTCPDTGRLMSIGVLAPSFLIFPTYAIFWYCPWHFSTPVAYNRLLHLLNQAKSTIS